MWGGSADNLQLVKGDFILCSSMTLGSYIFVVFIAMHGNLREEGLQQQIKSVAALTSA